ncbi:Metallo-dependent phosphatase [Coprinopsis marcescibilis]|uniref:Metallo-dependent phosphatase n=1 Tax=Coprinopsis marcescibilis TaxID=230819 RepID=A0A5C3KPW7_COPMA|nr:Metallo-dependent phosphatase [Coprinopsis marcescibilis]
MVYYSAESPNGLAAQGLGVINHPSNGQTGLTLAAYNQGLELWRASKTKPKATTLGIAHFNDVYQVSAQKINKEESIDVTKFASLLDGITTKWSARGDGSRDGLIVFSGDLFSPSTESSVTRGKHMPAIINAMKVDIGIVGNHEFDFGYPTLKTLINLTTFPWLLSNIIDEQTGNVPEPLKEFHIIERVGVKIGLIGLVERDWIPTITGWPENFKFVEMAEVGKKLSQTLRDPAGPHKCDLVIALTHSRIPNDIKLARELGALSPTAQATRNIASEHGVDILLGGHDHVYWISKGVGKWEGYDLETKLPDATGDQGDVLVVKSGTDFQDLSEVVLTLEDTPPGSIRKKVITGIQGKRHVTRGNTPVNVAMKKVYDEEIGAINDAMQEAIFISDVELNLDSSYIRLNESPIANWIADCLRHAYDEALTKLGYSKADGVLCNNGDFRGDRLFGPGEIFVGDLMTILPYLDPVVVLEIDGNTLWDALESGLSRWPTQEGRFPAISGFRVEWDSTKPPNQRVLGVWMLEDSSQVGPNGIPVLVDKEKVTRSDKKYLIVTGEYLSQGGDGYAALKGQKLVITPENGQSKSQLVRKFLSGAQLLNKELQGGGGGGGLTIIEPNSQPKARSIVAGVADQMQQAQRSFSIPMVSTFAAGLPGLTRSATANIAPTNVLELLAPSQFIPAALSLVDNVDLGLLDPYERRRARRHIANCQKKDQGCLECKTYGVVSIIQTGIARGVSVLSKSARMISSPGSNAASDDVKTRLATLDAADKEGKATLPVIRPVVDGRLKDVSKG